MSVTLRPTSAPSRTTPPPKVDPPPSKAEAPPSKAEAPPSKADAPPSKVGSSAPQAWRPMHHINQLRPQGADKDYANGAFNCGPAVVAMVARGWGHMGHLNDAQLVQQLGQGVVTRQGTSPEGIARMMERANVPLGGNALGAGYSEKDVQDHLLKGHKLIAQVRSSNPQSQKDSAHYVLVEGMTRNGNYIISDPLARGPYAVSPRQLKEAVLKAPPDGGVLIPVANPAEARPVDQKTAGAAVAAGGGARAVDTFVGPLPSVSPAERQAPAQAENPVTPYPLFAEPSVEESLKAPEKKAFTATEEVFKGIDTEFKETGSKPSDAQMAQNEKRNSFQLDIRYGSSSEPSDGPKQAVTAKKPNLLDFIRSLFQRKSRGDEKVYKTLGQLEASTFEQDKQVLREIKESDKKDPGIGVKTMGDAF
jgi:hypothetical protein